MKMLGFPYADSTGRKIYLNPNKIVSVVEGNKIDGNSTTVIHVEGDKFFTVRGDVHLIIADIQASNG